MEYGKRYFLFVSSSFLYSDPDWIRIQMGSADRYLDWESGSGSRQAKIVPKTKEKMKKFNVCSVLCWAGGFSWSVNVLFVV
jgi:hypothetical protein